MKPFSNTVLLNSDALCMRCCVCVVTTTLPIDLEANHRVSKHPSQNITLKPFRGGRGGVYRQGSCALSVLFFPMWGISQIPHERHTDPHFLEIKPKHTPIKWNRSRGQLKSLWSSSSAHFLQFIVFFFFEEELNKEMCVTWWSWGLILLLWWQQQDGWGHIWATVRWLRFTVQTSGWNWGDTSQQNSHVY